MRRPAAPLLLWLALVLTACDDLPTRGDSGLAPTGASPISIIDNGGFSSSGDGLSWPAGWVEDPDFTYPGCLLDGNCPVLGQTLQFGSFTYNTLETCVPDGVGCTFLDAFGFVATQDYLSARDGPVPVQVRGGAMSRLLGLVENVPPSLWLAFEYAFLTAEPAASLNDDRAALELVFSPSPGVEDPPVTVFETGVAELATSPDLSSSCGSTGPGASPSIIGHGIGDLDPATYTRCTGWRRESVEIRPLLLARLGQTFRLRVVVRDGGAPFGDAPSALLVDRIRLVEGVPIETDVRPTQISVSLSSTVSVYAYSSADFDATAIDPAATRLHVDGAGAGAAVATRSGSWMTGTRDYNADGLTDRLLVFRVADLVAAGLTSSSHTLVLRGTAAGAAYEGTDPTPSAIVP